MYMDAPMFHILPIPGCFSLHVSEINSGLLISDDSIPEKGSNKQIA